MPGIPDSEVVFNDLSELTPLVYSAIEAATQTTREFFDRETSQIDSWLAPCLVRYHAKRFLDNAGQDVEYEREELANNGLCLNYGKYQIRILKSDDGELPVPGPSQVRQAFYQQKQLSLDISISSERINLLVLWDVSSNHNLVGLSLSCPKGGETTRTSVEAYWTVPIPHPALSVKVTVESQDDIETLADLPIGKPIDVRAEYAE